ncbi:hypothetical protein [Lactiplantibacillus plantarum]|uniref:hypothetical protein n=1 Tax=Lactiplantibacillus plantarum TaxID=1590 RepID=UPI001F4D07B2|nr:hypothetical protein [Lactiplantibacillus plantarum]MCH8625837.1 hypothetical protein [Lactiplantibacillus plantarum]
MNQFMNLVTRINIISLVSVIASFSAVIFTITNVISQISNQHDEQVKKKSRLFFVSNCILLVIASSLVLIALFFFVMGVIHSGDSKLLNYYSQLATLLGVLITSLAALIALPTVSKYLMDKGRKELKKEDEYSNRQAVEFLKTLNKFIEENKSKK